MRIAMLALCVAEFAAACQDTMPRATAGFNPRPGLPASFFGVTLDDGLRSRSFRGSEQTTGRWTTPVVYTRSSGTLVVSFTLDAAGAVLSEGSVSVPLHADWEWDVSVSIDSIDPGLFCFGCSGSRAFPLASKYQRTIKDSVWVHWGGNSISNPVVY